MSTLSDRDLECRNWVKAMDCVKDGFEMFAEQISIRLHQFVLHQLGGNSSSQRVCPRAGILCDESLGKWKMSCCANSQQYMDEKQNMRYQNFNFTQNNWNNSNFQLCPRESWEMVKVYTNAGDKGTQNTPRDTYSSGILNLIDHCMKASGDVSNTFIISKNCDSANSAYTMSTLSDRLSDLECRNWVKAMYCVKDELETCAEQISICFHQYVLHQLGGNSSSQRVGPRATILFDESLGKWEMSCCANSQQCMDEIENMQYQNFSFTQNNWNNSNLQLCPHESWEMVKVYTNAGHKGTHKTQRDTYLSGILNLIYPCMITRDDISKTFNISKLYYVGLLRTKREIEARIHELYLRINCFEQSDNGEHERSKLLQAELSPFTSVLQRMGHMVVVLPSSQHIEFFDVTVFENLNLLLSWRRVNETVFEALKLLQNSRIVKDLGFLAASVLGLTLSEMPESSKICDSFLENSKPTRNWDFCDTICSLLKTPETFGICVINMTQCKLFTSKQVKRVISILDLCKPSFLCLGSNADLLFDQYECLQKLVTKVSEKKDVVIKTRCAYSLDPESVAGFKLFDTLPAVPLMDDASSATSVLVNSPLEFEHDFDLHDRIAVTISTQAPKRTVFAEKKRFLQEHTRCEFTEDVLKSQHSQDETERFPRYAMELSAQSEVKTAVFSETACPFSAEEEKLEILSKCVDLMEQGVHDRSIESFCKPLNDHYKQTRIGVGNHGLMEKSADYANTTDRALYIPNLAMSKQSRGADKATSKVWISNTFDHHNISHRISPKYGFKDESFRMIVSDETATEIENNDRVNELRRFSPITSVGRDHQLDRGSSKYCLGENWKDNDAEDDCHVLRQITWLPLNELPVPDIYTCITVHSAAQVILNRIASGERVGAQESMKFEILRVCTFRNYPSEDKPFRILFSIAGMYYASDRDEVVCYSCGLRKAGWKETDIPVDVHKKITPNCRFLVNNSAVNIPIPELEGSQLEKFKILEDLLSSNERPRTQQAEITGGSHGNFDLNTSQSPQYRFFVPPPKHPQYAVQSVRLDTFKGWPTNIPQTPQIMAECGYYYAGFGDCVRCFHCGIGLRHWTEDDYPWIEHARWSKDCAYLRQVKGEEFIQNVHLAIDQDEEPEDLIPATASGQPADMSQVTPNDDSNQILLTDPAQSVLEMGYQPRTIKKAIDIILRSEGRSGINAAKIMETIFMLEERSDNLEQEVANITISGASSETELQSQNGSEGSHNKATDENEKKCSAGQPPTSRSTGQNSSSNQTQRNTAKGQASNRNAGQAQRSSEVKTQVQKGTAVKSEDKGHAKSDPKKPPNRVTKNEDAASPKLSPHSSLEEKSKGATGTPSTSRDTFKIKAENQKLKEQTICKVCLDKPVSIVFLPCGHLVTCAECAPAMKKCPICRGIVKGMVKAFMS